MTRKRGFSRRAKLALFALSAIGFGVGPGAVTSAYAETVTAVTPLINSTGVCLGSAVTVQLSNGVNPNTANANGLRLIGPGSVQVGGFYNTDGAYSNVTFVPSGDLAPNTTYTVQVTNQLQSPAGNPYTPFSSTFTTGSSPCAPKANVSLTQSIFDVSASTAGPTALALGPNPNAPTQLWAAFGSGRMLVYNLNLATGMPVGAPTQVGTFLFNRIVSGLRFDPASTAGNVKLWVSNGQFGCDLAVLGPGNECDDFTGAISTLTGPNATALTKTDIVTGLPRSVGNHMNNGIDFGPDGDLYLAQGANTGYGDPDPIWGNRAEVPLAATILKIDVSAITSPPVNVTTDAPTNYDPTAPGAPVTRYVTGIRNPFTVIWHSNGRLYAPVNESASGNTPASPAQTGDVARPALTNLPSFNDYFTQVIQGKYYGHPNPSRGEYRLNGGNPTSGTDPFQVTQYAVGTQPNVNWRQPDLDLGQHRSANGSSEYRSGVFGAELQGKILVTEYAQGKDIIAVKIDANGNAVSTSVVASGFNNPLPLTTDAQGRIYVGEYGRDPDGFGGRITLLTPNLPTSPAPPSPKPCVLKNSMKITLRNAKRHRFTKLVVYVNGKKTKTVTSKKLGKGSKTKSFTIKLPTTKQSKVKIVGSRHKAKKRTYNKTFKPTC